MNDSLDYELLSTYVQNIWQSNKQITVDIREKLFGVTMVVFSLEVILAK
jgi:hypothetical protein